MNPKPSPGNPITGAILTTRGAVHYTTTTRADEGARPYVKFCDGKTLRTAQRTTVGALTCTACATKARQANWLMTGHTNHTALTIGMKVVVTQGFARGIVAPIEDVRALMYANPIDGITYHITDEVALTLGTWGRRTITADLIQPAH